MEICLLYKISLLSFVGFEQLGNNYALFNENFKLLKFGPILTHGDGKNAKSALFYFLDPLND